MQFTSVKSKFEKKILALLNGKNVSISHMFNGSDCQNYNKNLQVQQTKRMSNSCNENDIMNTSYYLWVWTLALVSRNEIDSCVNTWCCTIEQWTGLLVSNVYVVQIQGFCNIDCWKGNILSPLVHVCWIFIYDIWLMNNRLAILNIMMMRIWLKRWTLDYWIIGLL